MGATSELFIQIQDEIIQTTQRVEDGMLTPLDAVIDLRQKRAVLEDSLALIKDFEYDKLEEIEQAAKDYNNEYKGHKFEFRAGRKMFSFKNIKEWQKKEAEKKEVEEKAKAAFNLYQKTGAAPMTEEGEILELPEISYGKSSLVVKPLRK